MTKLAQQIDDSKLQGLALHMGGQMDRLTRLKSELKKSNIMIDTQEKSMTPVLDKVAAAMYADRRPFYTIEEATIDWDRGIVDVLYYRAEDVNLPDDEFEYLKCRIALENLEQYVADTGMNSYVMDWSDHAGVHQQEERTDPPHIMLEDWQFLYDAVKDYLEAGKEVE